MSSTGDGFTDPIVVDEGDGNAGEIFGYIPTPPHPPLPEPPVVPPPPAPGPTPEPLPAPVPEPDLGEGLPDSTLLALLLVALGLAALAKALADFFNWLMRKALGPLFGRAGSPSVSPEDVAQPLTNALGSQLQGVDAELGVSFTKLAQLVNQAGSWIKTEAQLVWTLANRQAATEGALSAATARSNAATHQAAAAAAGAQTAAESAQTTATAATQAEKAQANELQALTTHITTVIEPELDALRHAIPELQRGVSTAWDELAKHGEAIGIAGLTAGVLTVLGRVGAAWTTCDNSATIGRAMCGSTGNSLARLLLGGLPLLAAADVCAMLEAMTALASSGAVQGSLGFGADAIAGLLACTRSERAKPLDSVYYAPGALTAWGAAGALSV
jgi:hypothetical protein